MVPSWWVPAPGGTTRWAIKEWGIPVGAEVCGGLEVVVQKGRRTAWSRFIQRASVQANPVWSPCPPSVLGLVMRWGSLSSFLLHRLASLGSQQQETAHLKEKGTQSFALLSQLTPPWHRLLPSMPQNWPPAAPAEAPAPAGHGPSPTLPASRFWWRTRYIYQFTVTPNLVVCGPPLDFLQILYHRSITC